MKTNDKIKKIEDLYTEISVLTEKQSDLLKQAQVNQKVNKHTRDGNEVTEEMLWYEAYNLGMECGAVKILQPIYPELFAVINELNSKSQELNVFLEKEVGVSLNKMTVLDIIKICKLVK